MRLPIACACLSLLGTACGSRTGLLVDDDLSSLGQDGAAFDAAATDAGLDGTRVREAGLDAIGKPDVFRGDCPDAASQYIYVVSTKHELYSFDPAAASFHDIGALDCTGPNGMQDAFSMAVDRKGTAYVLLWDTVSVGELFRVSTATASCAAIPRYMPDQQGFGVFGMGFATNGGGPGETLYVEGASGSPFMGDVPGLASIDTTSFALSFIGNANPPITAGELTGTGDGRLFSLYYGQVTVQSFLGELDKATGQILSSMPLPFAINNGAFAFGYWGGDFYFFITPPPNQPCTVTRYRPSDGSFTDVATLNDVIVGAGVSTCAPQ